MLDLPPLDPGLFDPDSAEASWTLPANWHLASWIPENADTVIDNNHECYHCAVNHKSLMQLVDFSEHHVHFFQQFVYRALMGTS